MGDVYTIWNAFYVGQTTLPTCWRAGYEMMLRYKGRDPKLAYSLPNQSQMESRGIMDSEFAACAAKLGLGGIRYTYFQDIELLEHALRSWGPVWCSGFFLEGAKHIVVVAGIDPDERKVMVNDPWRAFTGAKGKPTWWSFSFFANNLNPVPWSCQLWY